MKEIRILFDFDHGPLWRDIINLNTWEFSTGISIIDNDKALNVLNEEAQKMYTSLYSFVEGRPVFDEDSYKKMKKDLLSLVQTIILRLEDINDGTYIVVDEETEKLME